MRSRWARGSDAQPVPVWVLKIHLAPGKSLLIDRDRELLRHRVDVANVHVNPRVRWGVAGVL